MALGGDLSEGCSQFFWAWSFHQAFLWASSINLYSANPPRWHPGILVANFSSSIWWKDHKLSVEKQYHGQSRLMLIRWDEESKVPAPPLKKFSHHRFFKINHTNLLHIQERYHKAKSYQNIPSRTIQTLSMAIYTKSQSNILISLGLLFYKAPYREWCFTQGMN